MSAITWLADSRNWVTNAMMSQTMEANFRFATENARSLIIGWVECHRRRRSKTTTRWRIRHHAVKVSCQVWRPVTALCRTNTGRQACSQPKCNTERTRRRNTQRFSKLVTTECISRCCWPRRHIGYWIVWTAEVIWNSTSKATDKIYYSIGAL